MLIINLIYILQSENYDAGGFLRFVYTHLNWRNLQKRQALVWTRKARVIYSLTYAFIVVIMLLSAVNFGFVGLLSIIPVIIFLPLIISLALIIIYPLDLFLKNKLIKNAQAFLGGEKKHLIIIGITGSYGKTSTKEILASILKEKFQVIYTTGNINTDIGIADFILKNKEELKNSEIFIVEMGAFRRGEIKKICDIVRPDYSILTGINESHLEKFGSLENTVKAKFELAEATRNETYLNINDVNIMANYDKFSIKNPVISFPKAEEIRDLENFQGLEFKISESLFRTKLLARHNLDLILISSALALKLGLNLGKIVSGVRKVDHIKHRLEPIYNSVSDIWVIDDSYNGNFNGIISGLDVLSRAKGRKVVLTPGLVEQGPKEEEIHIKIGKLYAKENLDLVLLVKNKVTDFIIKGMESGGFKNYKIYNSTAEAHADLGNILQKGDTIIFQNDWPDNYF